MNTGTYEYKILHCFHCNLSKFYRTSNQNTVFPHFISHTSHWTQIQHGSFLSWYPSVLPCLKLTSIFSWILERLAQLIHIPVQLHVCFCCFYYYQKSLCSSGHVLRTIPAFSIICEFLDKVLMTQNK